MSAADFPSRRDHPAENGARPVRGFGLPSHEVHDLGASPSRPGADAPGSAA